MRNLISKPIGKVEYVIHAVLILLTTGVWLLFFSIRIILLKKVTTNNSISTKNQILDKVNKLNSSLEAPTKTITYQKRVFATELEAEDDDWYEFTEPFSFEIVGESYKRNNLMMIIEKHNAFQAGVLELDALLKLEPDNKFDQTAVAVIIDGKPVGYVSSDLSLDVTSYMDDKDVNSMKLKARIGWDTSNPEPPIGVKLDFNF